MSNRKHSQLPTLDPIILFPFRLLTFRRLFRIGKWAAVICILLGVLLALLHLVENVRGKKEWARVKAETEAKGISLNWSAYIPEPIPDEINFVAAPVVAHFQYKSDQPEHHPWQEEWGDESDFGELFRFNEGGVQAGVSFLLEGELAWPFMVIILQVRLRLLCLTLPRFVI